MMNQLLKRISTYLKQKLAGLQPSFFAIYVTIPAAKYQELVETFPRADQDGALAFSVGDMLLYIMPDNV